MPGESDRPLMFLLLLPLLLVVWCLCLLDLWGLCCSLSAAVMAAQVVAAP